MSLPKIEVSVRPTRTPGPTKAHADVQLMLSNGEITLIGFAVIAQPGKEPFVGFPQNRGRNKYFPVVQAKGDIHDEIEEAILRAYKNEDHEDE
jgi:hypothetical protein